MLHDEQALAGQLDVLEAAQLIRRAADAELAYLFKHALTQDAVYQSLLKTTRCEFHGRVAEVMEQARPEQLDANAAVLAMHFEEAGNHAKAFEYAVRAGDRAAGAFAHAEALALYDRALELAARSPEEESEAGHGKRVAPVYVHKGRVLELMGNHPAAMENYRAMIAFAQAHGDEAMEADALNHLVTAQVVLSGPGPETDAQLERARELGERVGEPELTARALWNTGLAYRFLDTPRAVQAFQQALAIAEAEELREIAAHVRLDLNIALALEGHVREAHALARQALVDFRALDRKPMIADALASVASYAHSRGDVAEARALAEEGRQLSRAIENPWGALYNRIYTLILELEAGHLEKVLSKGEESVAQARQLGNPFFILNWQSLMVRALLALNEVDRAEAWAEQAREAFGGDWGSPLAAWAQWLGAQILFHRGEAAAAREIVAPMLQELRYPLTPFDEQNWLAEMLAELALAENRLDDGLALCNGLLVQFEREEQMGLAAPMYYWRAGLRRARGDLAGAEDNALKARATLERAEHRLLLWRAEALLAEIYGVQGRAREAGERRARAREIVEYIAAHAPAEARDSFLSAEEVQRITRS